MYTFLQLVVSVVTVENNIELFSKMRNCSTEYRECKLKEFAIRDSPSRYIVIHYSRAKCRKERMIRVLRNATFIETNDAARIDVNTLNNCTSPRLCENLPTMTQTSCTMKHMIAWNVASQSRFEYSVIVEDDMIFGGQFFNALHRKIKSLPDWEIFNVGCSRNKEISRGPVFCSRAYAVTRKGARKLIRNTPKIVETCDGTILKSSSSLKSYHANLPIVHGSQTSKGSLPRGYDMCDGYANHVEEARARAHRYYNRMKFDRTTTDDS